MEKAVLAIVDFRDKEYKDLWRLEDISAELKELVTSCGLSVLDSVTCFRDKPTPGYLIGTGKAEEIAKLSSEKGADVVIFSDDLSSAQQRNLEDIVGIKVIDRTQLILDIFAQRAHSAEGKVQVELAQLEYLLPRLAGKGTMLSRLGGGIGTRGPGEQKLEMDRRRVRDRISKLKDDLEKIHLRRDELRRKRRESDLAIVAIIGYTNAGKSTLLNALTHSDVICEDRLFSTLDPTARKFILPNNQKVVFVDTVGFLHNLPHRLIEAFKATLEEVSEADILVHILDISHPMFNEQNEAVHEVLKELDADNKPAIIVLNKIDRIAEGGVVERLKKNFENAIPISALKRENLHQLVQRIAMILSSSLIYVKALLPQSEAKLINQIYREGHIIKREFREQEIYIEAEIPLKLKNILDKNDFCVKI